MAIPKGKVKALKLRAVKNDLKRGRAYCGPTVLAAITGRKVSVIHELIKEQRYGSKRERRRYYNSGGTGPAITGTSSGDLNAVLRHYGLHMRCVFRAEWPSDGPTLAAWLRQRTDRSALYIVNVTAHWVAVKGNKFVDSHTMVPVWLREAPHRRKRVVSAWLVELSANRKRDYALDKAGD